MAISVIMHDDIFEYLTTYICIYDYDKLRKVSVKFNRAFNIYYKSYEQIMQMIGSDDIIKFIESKIINKYSSDICKSSRVDKSKLFRHWYYDNYIYSVISKHFIKFMALNKEYNIQLNKKLNIGIYIESGIMYIEQLIALLYNSECMNYKNLVNILKRLYELAVNIPIKDVNNIKWICERILDTRIEFSYYNSRFNIPIKTSRFKISYKQTLYQINVSTYIAIVAKSYYTYKTVNYILEPFEFNEVWLTNINNMIDNHKNILETNIQKSRVFPKYYADFILNVLNNCYVGL